MIKYISLTVKGLTTINQVDVREVAWMEDPSLAWRLTEGEGLYEIINPPSLKKERYYSFFFANSELSCFDKAIDELYQEAKRTARKTNIKLDELKMQEKIANIKIIKL